MHQAAVVKAHLVLGRMHVDVHRRRVEFQKKHVGWVAAVIQDIVIGLPDGVGDDLVAHNAPVDVEVLQVGLAARKRRQADPAPQAQSRRALLQRQRVFQKGGAADQADAAALFQLARRGAQIAHHALVVAQAEMHVESAQGQAFEHLVDASKLGSLGFQELFPRGRVEKQVAHFHRGAGGVLARFQPNLHLLAFGADGPAGAAFVRGRPGRQFQARNRADARQRLAAETQAGDGGQVFRPGNLAGGVAAQREREIVLVDAATVVAHPQQLLAALLDIDINARGAGVETVLKQFLEHRSGAFHHLARGYLVGQARTQSIDAVHLDFRVFGFSFRIRRLARADASARRARTTINRCRLGGGFPTRRRPRSGRPPDH